MSTRERTAAHRGRTSTAARTPAAVRAVAPLWWRSAALRRSTVMLTVTFALIGAVFVSVASFDPSSTRQADQLFGSYQQLTSVTLETGQAPAGTLKRARSTLAAAVPDAHVYLDGGVLTPDSNARAIFYESAHQTVFAIEDGDLRAAFPGRYHLDAGRWPRAANEVVVSHHQLGTLPDPQRFTVLSGQTTMRVVGVITDDQQRHGDVIVAGPGTFEALTPRPPQRRYEPSDYKLNVLWGSRGSAEDVSRAIAPLLPPPPDQSGSRADEITQGHITRAAFAADKPEPVFGTDRFVVSYLPLALIALLVAAFAAATTRTAQRADTARLLAIGLRRSTITTSRAITSTAASTIAITGGLALGWAIAAALRTTVLYRLADQPLSPIPALPRALAIIAVTTLVLLVTATTWPAATPGTPGTRGLSRWLAEVHTALLRRVVVVLLAITALQAGGGPYSVLATYLMVAAVLLTVPDLLALAVRALPRTRARPLLTASMMRTDLRRQATAALVIGACIAVPACAGTQLLSRTASDATFGFAGVPRGQIWVQGNNDVQDIDGVARAVAATPGIGEPIVVQQPRSSGDPQDQGYREAIFTHQQLTGSSSYSIMVLDSAGQLRALLGPALPASAERTLADGGVIDFTRTEGDQSFIVGTTDGKTLLTTAPLPTARFNPGKIWRGNYGGVVLRSTMDSLGISVNSPRSYYFTEVSEAGTSAAVTAAVTAGYDDGFVQYHVDPFPPQVPPAAYVFLAALALGAFAVLLLVVGGQASRLRAYTARLVAIGLTPRWTRGILTQQAGLTVGTGLVAGAAAGLLGVRTTADHYAHLVVPTTAITIALVATVLAAAAATALAARRLSATEHPEVT